MEAKLTEQRKFVLWWDGAKHGGKAKPGRTAMFQTGNIATLAELGIDRLTMHRWRTRLADGSKGLKLLAADDRKSQDQAASEAGLSPRQTKTAVRVANVPAEAFEAAVDSDAPPHVTELAAQRVRGILGRRNHQDPAPMTNYRQLHEEQGRLPHASSGYPLTPLLTLLAFTGCATYSQMMINPLGQAMMCQASGRGLVAAEQAQSMQERCLASLRAAGYIEIERAGVIGVMVSDSLDIIRVVPGSPADSVGVRPGDHLEQIDRQSVRDRATVTVLLFGAPGTEVRLGLVRAGQPLEVVAIRKPYPAVHGQPPPR